MKTPHYDRPSVARIEKLPRGEFFKRIIKGQPGKEVYTREEYDRSTRRYSCSVESDISRSIELKKGALVQVGFTY